MAQRVVQSRLQQRAEDPFGGHHAGLLQRVHRVPHQGGQVVRAVGQRGVVERSGPRGDPHRLGAHLQYQCLPDAPTGLVGDGDADAGRAQPGDILAATGEGHRWMQREGQHPGGDRRIQHLHPPGATGVHHDLTGSEDPRGSQPGDQAGQHVIRDGQQHEVGPVHDVVGGQYRSLG